VRDCIVKDRRGVNPVIEANKVKTHCPRGHPLSGKNLKLGRTGHRSCKVCSNASALRSKWRKRLRAV
jgi:hypothetical protein